MQTVIKPIEKNNVIDIVFTEMMDMIVLDRWHVGDKIPSENDLAERFGVSRNSIKQAIQRINALGLLEARQGGGTFVKLIDTSFYLNMLIPTVLLGEKNAIKMFEFQKGIQIECTRLACRHGSDEQISRLLGCLHNMERNLDNRTDTSFLESDMRFHKTIAEMSQNGLFIKATEIIESLLHISMQQIVHRFSRDRSLGYHARIAEALSRRDAATAAEQMDEHLSDVIHKLEGMVKSDTGTQPDQS